MAAMFSGCPGPPNEDKERVATNEMSQPSEMSLKAKDRVAAVWPNQLSLSSLGASFFGCFQPCWFFQMPFPSFWFVGALYVAWVFFTWVYFLLELFFLCVCCLGIMWSELKWW